MPSSAVSPIVSSRVVADTDVSPVAGTDASGGAVPHEDDEEPDGAALIGAFVEVGAK